MIGYECTANPALPFDSARKEQSNNQYINPRKKTLSGTLRWERCHYKCKTNPALSSGKVPESRRRLSQDNAGSSKGP